jgi:hypothetical protein
MRLVKNKNQGYTQNTQVTMTVTDAVCLWIALVIQGFTPLL